MINKLHERHTWPPLQDAQRRGRSTSQLGPEKAECIKKEQRGIKSHVYLHHFVIPVDLNIELFKACTHLGFFLFLLTFIVACICLARLKEWAHRATECRQTFVMKYSAFGCVYLQPESHYFGHCHWIAATTTLYYQVNLHLWSCCH